jgi:hypothetical protein
MVQSKQKEVKETVSKVEFDKLQKQLDELKKMISQPKENKYKGKIQEDIDEDDSNDDIKISSDSYIKVMSLNPYLLTLTTQEYGRGKKFNFEKFGDVKRILYHDLCDIMEQHQNFLNDGRFIILNRDVVRKHGLDELYAKILTKEKIEVIVRGNDTDAVNLFRSCGEVQRDSIATMFIEKLVNGEQIDLNLLDRLSRVIGYNIADRAEETKKFSELTRK